MLCEEQVGNKYFLGVSMLIYLHIYLFNAFWMSRWVESKRRLMTWKTSSNSRFVSAFRLTSTVRCLGLKRFWSADYMTRIISLKSWSHNKKKSNQKIIHIFFSKEIHNLYSCRLFVSVILFLFTCKISSCISQQRM